MDVTGGLTGLPAGCQTVGVVVMRRKLGVAHMRL